MSSALYIHATISRDLGAILFFIELKRVAPKPGAVSPRVWKCDSLFLFEKPSAYITRHCNQLRQFTYLSIQFRVFLTFYLWPFIKLCQLHFLKILPLLSSLYSSVYYSYRGLKQASQSPRRVRKLAV